MNYSSLDKINLFIAIYGRLFSWIFRMSLWLPFLLLALVQAAGLYAFSKFYVDGLYQIIHPVLSRFFPQEIFHFPQYYLALPSIYSGYDVFILGPTIGVVLTAVAVYKFGGYHQNNKLSFNEGIKASVKSYFPLLFFWILETFIVLAVLLGLSLTLADMLRGSPRLKFAFEFGFHLFAYIFSALLIYAIPGIILSGKSFFKAIGDSIRLCGKNFFLTFFIVAVPGSLGAAIDIFISNYSIQIIRLFDPEIILWILYIRVGLGIFINLFIYGAAVYVYKKMSD